MTELADAIAEVADSGASTTLLYDDDLPIIRKVETLASEVYKAGRVDWGPMTRTTSRRFDNNGWNYPVCMAKTHLSVSADRRLRGAPTGHTLPIREVRVLAGARQIVTLAGDIMTLPGLPSEPNALDIDLDESTGRITGLLGA